MKKTLSLIMAILLVLSLFAGCAPNNPAPTPTTGTTAEPDTGNTDTQPTDEPDNTEDSLYNLPAGKFEVDENGFPTAPYDYTEPFTTSDEVLTYWGVVWTPQLLPEEGYNATPLPEAEREATGVNVEYVIVSMEARQANYSVLLAADDLCDMMTGSLAFHPTTIEEAVEDEYYINIYDYKDYCPNYIYQVTYDRKKDSNTYATVFRSPDFIGAFYTMSKNAGIGTNYVARGDWLDKLGMTNDDIVTYDDLHDMLLAFKTNIDTCEFPWPMFSSIDVANYSTFTAYDTLPSVSTTSVGPMYVIDGAVQFSHVTERDKNFMTMLNSWYSDGLIDPSWSSYDNNTVFKDKTTNNKVGYMVMNISEVSDYEVTSIDPNTRWVPIKRPVLYEGQTFHLGGQTSRLGMGTVSISAKCKNIPLAVTWCDWRYSPTGSDIISWGPEGVIWEYDEEGKRVATEFAISNPEGVGFAWLCMFYGFNALNEHGIGDGDRSYLVPGNERMREISAYWAQWDYDAAYDFPSGVKLTPEQTEEVANYSNDIVTYITENYLAFVDGSKPLSEWDSYVDGLMKHGFQEVVAVYQEAYDTYISTMA